MNTLPSRYEYKTVKSEDQTVEFINEWLNHLVTVFTDTPYEYFKQHHYSDPNRDKNVIFVVIDKENENKIVSTVKIFYKQMYLRDSNNNFRIVNFGGIGEVSTNINYRGNGFSVRLLEMSVDYMKKNNIDLSVLFSSKYSKLYNSKGWSYVDRSITVETLHRDPQQDSNDNSENNLISNLEIESITSEQLRARPDYISKLLDTQKYNAQVIRDVGYWSEWIAGNISLDYPCWLLKSGGNVVGFISTGLHNSRLHINDIAISQSWLEINKQDRDSVIVKMVDLVIKAYFIIKSISESVVIEELQYPTPILQKPVYSTSNIKIEMEKNMMVRIIKKDSDESCKMIKPTEEQQSEVQSLFPLDSTIYWSIDKF